MKNTGHNSFKELYVGRHEPENLRPIAELYWRLLLAFAIIAAGCSILFGVWEFSSVMKIVSAASNNSGTQQAAPLDRTQLESVLNKFSERRENFELAKGRKPTVTDPMR